MDNQHTYIAERVNGHMNQLASCDFGDHTGACNDHDQVMSVFCKVNDTNLSCKPLHQFSCTVKNSHGESRAGSYIRLVYHCSILTCFCYLFCEHLTDITQYENVEACRNQYHEIRGYNLDIGIGRVRTFNIGNGPFLKQQNTPFYICKRANGALEQGLTNWWLASHRRPLRLAATLNGPLHTYQTLTITIERGRKEAGIDCDRQSLVAMEGGRSARQQGGGAPFSSRATS